jgi:hypothetical protein
MTDTYTTTDGPPRPGNFPPGPNVSPEGRLRVTPIGGGGSVPGGGQGDQGPPAPDPWAGFSATPPTSSSSGTKAAEKADPWAAFSDQPPVPKGPHRAIGAPEAALRGAESGFTFGTAPAIAGAHEAGMETLPPEAREAIKKHGHEPVLGALIAGLARLGYENLIAPALGIDPRTPTEMASDQKGGAATKTYNRVRESRLSEDRAAREQNPVSFIGGQVVGSVANPTSGIGRTAATVTSTASSLTPGPGAPGGEAGTPSGFGRGAKAGAVGGGLYGAGEAISEGKGVSDVLEDTGKGIATGATIGGVTGQVLESGAKGVARIRSLVRGKNDPDAEAARIVLEDLNRAREKAGKPAFTKEELDAANAAGSPRALVDLGDEKTRALGRVSANKSPEGREALELLTDSRYRNMSPRVADFVRTRTGSRDAGGDLLALQDAARKANRPLYKAAYAAGDRPIWNSEIERLVNADEVQAAIRDAAKRGSNRAVADGMGGFNPPITVHPDGRITFNKGPTGVPTYPNIQFWDYVQRELRDSWKSLERVGKFEQADAVNQLRQQLNKTLDSEVKQFATARGTAFKFFNAENALEAGQKAVMMNKKLPDMMRELSKMNAYERELFRRGFASELADRIEPMAGRGSIDAAFVVSQPAKRKIEAALGRDFALELEALLRVEAHLDKARRSLGNSTTARQLHEMTDVGGGMATVEAIKEHGMSPSHMIATIFGIKKLQGSIEHIDSQVAQKVGELLASDTPAKLAKGLRIVTSSPRMMDALRRATSGGAIVGAHDIGPEATAAGIGTVVNKLVGARHDAHPHERLIEDATQ